MTTPSKPIRVLVVEDSPTCRELMVSVIQSAAGFQVVGTARDGAEAVRLTHRLRPDIIIMDVHMPVMNGYEAVNQIMAEVPRPIIMVTNSLAKNEHHLTFNALEAGALIILEKPALSDPVEKYEWFLSQMKTLAEVKVVRRWSKPAGSNHQSQPLAKTQAARRAAKSEKIRVVAIAASTGGPGALATVLKELPANFPVPVLIVQHVTYGFGQGLADWLGKKTRLQVRLARHGDELQAGEVLIAPDDYHMIVNGLGLVALHKETPYQGLRPAANYLFDSVARVYGATAVGIILTGMGNDGASGLQAMRRAGAHTIAQDRESCVVFGMPAVAIELDAAEEVQPLNCIASALLDWIERQ
ncbi:MAG: chemotaxis-specific protein-glutamate methyltransferase CheB [Chloroflexi bacterium]|nr:chemotaxis-specific protein-glutamate methyltransferase CheB [Chloroflexota bacterium]MCI0575181.1 chemotaxis-specific protein-glutamate methyltransferase CheB [Chloroflexota bacterium]MCI0647137.1 chemotaxis-specific protein-glutamate methyltransferase CheB [Chloroflexota bacterium]MCI0729987.1 chemotaxis-specific protein-glutamate methyltransferase CheB [Chloroflexota bacterium]